MSNDKSAAQWCLDLEAGTIEKHNGTIHGYEHEDLVRVIEYSAFEKSQEERMHFWQICIERAKEVELLKAEIERLKEYEFMYKELCK